MTDAAFSRAFKRDFASLGKLIDESTRTIIKTVNAAIAKPQVSKTFWDETLLAVDNEYNKMLRALKNWTKAVIPKQYEAQFKAILDEVAKTENIVTGAVNIINQLEQRNAVANLTSRLYKDAIAEYARAITGGRIVVERITRMTKQKLVSEFAIDSAVAKAYESGDIANFSTTLAEENPAYRELLKTMDSGRLLEVNGRHYTPEYYAEMVARTKIHAVQTDAAKGVCSALGTDLIKISDHNTTTELCMPHEGQIYSISGDHPDYPELEEEPPFHPNCLHTAHPYFESAISAERGE